MQVFEELKAQSEVRFHFRDKQEPYNYVRMLSSNLQVLLDLSTQTPYVHCPWILSNTFACWVLDTDTEKVYR